MAKKVTNGQAKQGKAAIIRDYLAEHPTHTWKDAEATLSKHDISAAYFAMTKSNNKKRAAPRIELVGASGSSESGPTDPVAFARACGGIDRAITVLKELKRMQV